jgi:imidazolonepropionase-like amidohydrolase
MTIRIDCGRLFTGLDGEVHADCAVLVEGEAIVDILPRHAEGDRAAPAETIDLRDSFVMPGLVDVHTHLAYGNAKSEEDVDLYGSLEFRAVRGLFFAQQVLAAGVTSICSPGDTGQVSAAVRDAVDAGLFEGPSITAAGPYITSRQGLTDWYPSWIGAPSTANGRLVRSRDEAIEEIRRQVKDGVDAVKIALDGIERRPDGEHVAAFTRDETKAMVDEIHRLGRKAIAHARGREATLYAAEAGVDLIFHASYMDEEGLDWILRNNCAVSPTLTLLHNSLDFMQAADPFARKGRDKACRAEFETAVERLAMARKAGVPMPTGTDTGFAVTPYGEWHAREIEIYVDYLGFSPAEALRGATSVGARLLRSRDRVGRIEKGCKADLLAVRGDPLKDVSVLLDRERFAMVMKNGKRVSTARRTYDPRKVSDFSLAAWNELYTQDRVREIAAAAEPEQSRPAAVRPRIAL